MSKGVRADGPEPTVMHNLTRVHQEQKSKKPERQVVEPAKIFDVNNGGWKKGFWLITADMFTTANGSRYYVTVPGRDCRESRFDFDSDGEIGVSAKKMAKNMSRVLKGEGK